MSIKVFVVLALVAVAAASPTPCHLLKEKGIIRGGVLPLPISLPKPKLGLRHGPILLGKCSLGGNLGVLFKTLIGHKHYARNNLKDILNLKVGSFNDVCYLLSRLVVSLCDSLEASIRGLGSLLSRVIFSLLRIIICFVGGAGSGNPICRNDINLLVGVKDVAVGDARGMIDLYGLVNVQARLNLLIHNYTRGRGIKACHGSLRIVLQLVFDLVNRIQIIIARTGSLSKADFKFCFHKITCLLGVMGNSHKKGLGLQIINDFVPMCNQFIISAGFPDVSDIADVRKDVEYGNDDRAPWAMPDIEGVTDTSVTISLGGLIGNLFKGLIGVTRLASNLVQDIIGFVINTVDDVFTLVIKIVLGLGGALDATIAGLGSLLVRIVAGLLKIVLCFLGTGKYGVCRPGWDRQVGVNEDVTSIDLLIRLYGLNDCDEQVNQHIYKYTKGRGIETTKGSVKIFLQSLITLSQMIKSRKFESNTIVIVIRHVTYLLGAIGNSNSKGVGTTICNKFIPDINKFLIQAGYPGLGNSQPEIIKIVQEADDDDYTWCADIDADNSQTGFIEPKPLPGPKPTPSPVRPTSGPVRPTATVGPVRPTAIVSTVRPTVGPVRPTPGPVRPTKPTPLGGLFKIIFGSIRGVSKLAFKALNIITSITINTLNDVFSLLINLSLVLEVTLNNLVVGLGSFFSRLVACIIKIGVCVNGFPGDRNICTRDWNSRYGYTGEAKNADDLIVLFKLNKALEDFNSLVYRHTRGKGIKSIKQRSVRYILERIRSLVVVITNYKKITRQSITESFVIVTSISASVGNSRQRNSGKQIIEKLLPQCGNVFKKEGYPDITIEVTVITKDCDDSNDDNTDWNGGDNGNNTPSPGGNNGNTTPSGGDNGYPTPSGGDNGKTTPSGGDNGYPTPSGGDNGNATPSPGGDNGNYTPSGGDNGNTKPSGGDNANTTPSPGGDNGKTTPSGDNGNTKPSGGDNTNTTPSGGDNGYPTSSGGDNGNATPSPGGDNGNYTPSGGDNGNTKPSGGDNANTTPSPGGDNGKTTPSGDNGNTKPSGGDNTNTTPSGGDNGYPTPSGGDNGNATPSPGGDNGNYTPSGGDNGNTKPSGGDNTNTTPSPGGDNGNYTPSGGDNGNTKPSGGDNTNTTPSGGDNGYPTPSGGDNGNATPSPGGDNGNYTPSGDNGNTKPSGGDNDNTTPSGGNNGNDNDCGKDIGDIIQVIPGVTKLSTTVISEIIKIKITTLSDIVDLTTKLTLAIGGIIDSIVDGLGSILIRLVAVIYKIGFCVNGYSSNRAICTKEWNAKWAVVGEATTGVDLIALFRVNDCKSDVTKMIDKYTGGKGIGSTNGFIKFILQTVLEIANIVSSGTITKEHFTNVFIYIISMFGTITNNYKQGSATLIIQRIIPVCAPIFVKHGCSDIRSRQKSLISTINIAANVRFDWTTVKVGDNTKAEKLATNVKKVLKNVKNDKNVKAPSLNAVLNLQAPHSLEDTLSFGVQVVQGLGSVIDVFINGLGSLIVRIVGCLIHYIVAILGGARNSKSFVSQKAYFEIFGVTVSGGTWEDHVTGFEITKCKEDLDDILDSYTNKKGRGTLSGAEGACFDVAYSLVAIVAKGSAIVEGDLTAVLCQVTTLLGAFANSASAGVGKTIVDNMLPTCSYYLEQNNYPSLASQQSYIFKVIDGCNNVRAPWTSSTTTTVEVQEN